MRALALLSLLGLNACALAAATAIGGGAGYVVARESEPHHHHWLYSEPTCWNELAGYDVSGRPFYRSVCR
mgnify:FL=1|jgi:hypothetical protein